MNCTVNASDFHRALKKVYQASMKNSTLPALGNALAEFHGDHCTLTCTNLEQWCQITIPAHGGEATFVFQNTDRLLTACKYFSGDINLEYTMDTPPKYHPSKENLDGSLSLHCGTKECLQRVISADDFPVLPSEVSSQQYEIHTSSVFKRYERIKYAASKDTDQRPTRCCVEFMDNRMVTLDGYRAAISTDPSFHVEKPFFIPTPAMKLLSVFEGADCTLRLGERYAVFDNGSIKVITRIPGNDGLDMDKILSQPFSEECIIDVDAFIGELNYLKDISTAAEKAPIRFQNGTLSIQNTDGEYRAKLELNTVPQTICGFKAQYMLDGLKQFKAKNAKRITMRMTSPLQPIFLTDELDDTALVLPVRLKNAA